MRLRSDQSTILAETKLVGFSSFKLQQVLIGVIFHTEDEDCCRDLFDKVQSGKNYFIELTPESKYSCSLSVPLFDILSLLLEAAINLQKVTF